MHKLIITFVVAITAPPLFAQSPDRVVARDPKTGKAVTVEGLLTESPSGVVVTVGGKEKARFEPDEIVRLDLNEYPGLSPDDRSRLFGLDNEKDPEKAARGYATLVPKAVNDRVRRALEFREVMALLRVVDATDEAGFKAAAPATADRLAAFAAANAKSWESYPSAHTAARLYADLGQFERAAAVLAKLAAGPGLAAALRIEATLAEADVLLRSADPAAGRAVVSTLLADQDVPATGLLRERLSIYDLRAPAPGTRPDEHAAKLKAAIDAATTLGARASGFLALGDLWLAHGRPRDEMWEYLNVEVVYNQDPDEVRKALKRLVAVFEKLDDPDRAAAYREKVRTFNPRESSVRP